MITEEKWKKWEREMTFEEIKKIKKGKKLDFDSLLPIWEKELFETLKNSEK